MDSKIFEIVGKYGGFGGIIILIGVVLLLSLFTFLQTSKLKSEQSDSLAKIAMKIVIACIVLGFLLFIWDRFGNNATTQRDVVPNRKCDESIELLKREFAVIQELGYQEENFELMRRKLERHQFRIETLLSDCELTEKQHEILNNQIDSIFKVNQILDQLINME